MLPALGCALALPACALDDATQTTPSEADARRGASPDLSVDWQPVDFSPGAAFFVSHLTIENLGPGTLG
ncbi:MAG TPA: hypothetical protein VGD80_29625, partial [Kofleriaceae bacterium]